MSEVRDYARYEGKKLRTAILKELNNDVTTERLCSILKAEPNYLKFAYRCNLEAGYKAGRPNGTALCWECKWATGLPNSEGKRCPWSSNLESRNDWITEDEYDEQGVLKTRCVCDCQGFEMDCTQLEKKYVIGILYTFFKQVNPSAFSLGFFIKAKTTVFYKWLDLYNKFRQEVLDMKPIVVISDFVYDENYDYDDNTPIE